MPERRPEYSITQVSLSCLCICLLRIFVSSSIIGSLLCTSSVWICYLAGVILLLAILWPPYQLLNLCWLKYNSGHQHELPIEKNSDHLFDWLPYCYSLAIFWMRLEMGINNQTGTICYLSHIEKSQLLHGSLWKSCGLFSKEAIELKCCGCL